MEETTHDDQNSIQHRDKQIEELQLRVRDLEQKLRARSCSPNAAPTESNNKIIYAEVNIESLPHSR